MRRNESDPDAFDPMRALLSAGQHRRFRGLCGNDVNLGVVTEQDPRHAVERMGSADRLHECVDAAGGLAPELFSHRLVARSGVCIAELVEPPVTGLTAEFASG